MAWPKIPWNRGRPRTEAEKRNISIATKAAMTPEICKKIVLNRGPTSKEVKEKIRQAHIKPVSKGLECQVVELYVNGASQDMVAVQLSISRNKIPAILKSKGIAIRNLLEAAQLAWRLGRSPAMSSGIHKPGRESIHWRGGTSFEPYTVEFRDKQESIRARDSYTCQICGVSQAECLEALSVHHINYNKKNDADNNLISLCTSCHGKTNTNREYWQTYLSNLLKRRESNAVPS